MRITAPNESPYTFRGTNTYVIGGESVAVIDPGPDLPGHLDALRQAIGGRPLEAILLTHTHRDHCALAPRLAAETATPLWFAGAHDVSTKPHGAAQAAIRGEADATLTPARVLRHGERFGIAGMVLDVHGTPGHCANHLAFGVTGTPYIFTGDHVMGWSSTLIAPPDGSLRDYFSSLDRLIRAPQSQYLPGHGGLIPEGRDFARALRAHREGRNRQILAALQRGPQSVPALLRAVYPGIARPLRAAARLTLEAHIAYLTEQGQVAMASGLLGAKVRLSGASEV